MELLGPELKVLNVLGPSETEKMALCVLDSCEVNCEDVVVWLSMLLLCVSIKLEDSCVLLSCADDDVVSWKFIDDNVLVDWKFIDDNVFVDWELIEDDVLMGWKFIDDNVLVDWKFIDDNVLVNWEFIEDDVLIGWKFIDDDVPVEVVLCKLDSCVPLGAPDVDKTVIIPLLVVANFVDKGLEEVSKDRLEDSAADILLLSMFAPCEVVVMNTEEDVAELVELVIPKLERNLVLSTGIVDVKNILDEKEVPVEPRPDNSGLEVVIINEPDSVELRNIVELIEFGAKKVFWYIEKNEAPPQISEGSPEHGISHESPDTSQPSNTKSSIEGGLDAVTLAELLVPEKIDSTVVDNENEVNRLLELNSDKDVINVLGTSVLEEANRDTVLLEISIEELESGDVCIVEVSEIERDRSVNSDNWDEKLLDNP
ncbi:hypothetical protein B7494_g2322 [Chlorociboria aeruginascens]|nr:hypothetical protein B7494_g2322 [Chlorociboria aeruginascens]